MKKLALLFAVFFTMSGFVNTAKAIGISIDLNDRPYYTYGDRYWASSGAYWCWVPGHWGRRHHHNVWIHGHYRPC